MKNLTFTAFDTETATNNCASVCQIGYVVVTDGQITAEKSFLIQPPNNEYDARHSCIHGVDALTTKDKPLFPEVWENIKNEFIGVLLVAHNISFDLNILLSTLDYYNLPKPNFAFDCTYKLTGLKLKALAEAFQIPIIKQHDALSDAKICAQAFMLLKQGNNPNHNLINENINASVYAGHERLIGDILKPDLNVENNSAPFYSKKVVFTGVLQTFTREDAAQIVKNLGADIDTAVNKKTDYVIVGQGAGPSKLNKIQNFNASGANIRILNETDFLSLINSRNVENKNIIKHNLDMDTHIHQDFNVDFIYSQVISFSMQQNHIPVIRKLLITNSTGKDIQNISIELTFEPEFATPISTKVLLLREGESQQLNNFDLKLSPKFLSELSERLSGTIRFVVQYEFFLKMIIKSMF
jgi:DNA polymerase-3 subunit epsilon